MKVKLSEQFESWFKKTNPHIFEDKQKKRSEITKEFEEYVNDVLFEHMEDMQRFLNARNKDNTEE
jgi:hypothetical protein